MAADDQQQLQITFPSGWGSVPNLPPDAPKLVCQGPDMRAGYRQTFLLNFGPRGALTAEQFLAETEASLQNLERLSVLTEEDATVSGHPATLRELQYAAQGRMLGALVWLAVTPSWAINATYIAADPLTPHDRAVAAGIIGSLQLDD